MIYNVELVVVSLFYIIRTIMAFRDKVSLKWFRLANNIKYVVLVPLSANVTNDMLWYTRTKEAGENILYGFALLFGIVEIIFMLCEYWYIKMKKA